MGLLGNGIEASLIPHHINLTQPSQVTAEDYQMMIDVIKRVKEDDFPQLGLDSCSIEDELNKVRAKTTLKKLSERIDITLIPVVQIRLAMIKHFLLMFHNKSFPGNRSDYSCKTDETI